MQRIKLTQHFSAFLILFILIAPFNIIAKPSDDEFMKAVIESPAISEYQLSDDGLYLAYTISKRNIESNTSNKHLFITTTDGKQTYQSDKPFKGKQLQWRPNTSQLSYVETGKNGAELVLVTPQGKPIKRVPFSQLGQYFWMPDGKQLFIVKRKGTRQYVRGRYEIKGEYSTQSTTYLANPDSGKTSQLFETSKDAKAFSISPDGRYIAYTLREPTDHNWYFGQIEIFDIKARKSWLAVAQKGAHSGLKWSNDGNRLLYVSHPDKTVSNTPHDILSYSIKDKQIQNLTKTFDNSAFVIEQDNDYTWFIGTANRSRNLYKLANTTNQIEQVKLPLVYVGGVRFNQNNKTQFIVSGVARDSDPHLYSVDTKTGKSVALTAKSATPGYQSMARSELLSWKARDGLAIDGILFKPDNFDKSVSYPLIVDIHGGPRAQDYPFMRSYDISPLELAINKGALVFKVNYRGSIGKGDDFIKAHHRQLGKDVMDVIDGVDYLVKKGFVDTNRIVMQGWSYGGFIADYLSTMKQHPFKSIYSGAGISDWTVHLVHEADNVTTRDFSFGATPWEDPEIYKKSSPITYINNAQTPMLIIHGNKDPVCNVTSAQLLYQGLKDKGVEVKYLEFDGMGHFPTTGQQRYALYWHTWQWLNQHLWDKSIELPASL